MAITKEEAQALTLQGLQALTDDPAQWRQWASTYAKFHTYSVGNVLMITQQQPRATRVAGFHVWQGLGRTVKKGERGIAIFAPVTKRAEDLPTQDPTGLPHSAAPGPEPGKERVITGFRVVYVFDIAQTEGPALTLPQVPLIHGEGFDRLWKQCVSQAPVPVTEKVLEEPGLLGFYAPRAGTITIQQALSPDQKLATLLHELGHYAGHPPGEELRAVHVGTEEIVAEVTGFVLAEALGLDVREQSLHYTAMHALGERQAVLDTMTAVGERVRELMPWVERMQTHAQQAVPGPALSPSGNPQRVAEAAGNHSAPESIRSRAWNTLSATDRLRISRGPDTPARRAVRVWQQERQAQEADREP